MRVIERRGSKRVLEHWRFEAAHRLHDLHVGVRLEVVFRACDRAPGEPASFRASAFRGGASSSRPSCWGSSRGRLSCACSSTRRAYEFKGIGVSEGRIVFTSFAVGFTSRASFVRVFGRRASQRVQGHRRFGGAHHLHVLRGGVRLGGVFRAHVRAPTSSRVQRHRRFGGAHHLHVLHVGVRIEGVFPCACSSAGRAYEFKGIGVSEGRIIFTSFTLGFVSRASFVRVFERLAGLRVQGHRRFGGAHRLHTLHVGVSFLRVFVRRASFLTFGCPSRLGFCRLGPSAPGPSALSPSAPRRCRLACGRSSRLGALHVWVSFMSGCSLGC